MVEQQTWVVVVATASFAVALFGYLGAIRRDFKGEFAGLRSELKRDIAGLRSELKRDIAGLRSELKGDIGEVKSELAEMRADVRMLNQRTYDLSTRLPPAPAPQQ